MVREEGTGKGVLVVVESVAPWDLARADDLLRALRGLAGDGGWRGTLLLSGSGAPWALPGLHEPLARTCPVAYVVREDLARHGISPTAVADGVVPVRRGDLASLVGAHDLVWWW